MQRQGRLPQENCKVQNYMKMVKIRNVVSTVGRNLAKPVEPEFSAFRMSATASPFNCRNI